MSILDDVKSRDSVSEVVRMMMGSSFYLSMSPQERLLLLKSMLAFDDNDEEIEIVDD